MKLVSEDTLGLIFDCDGTLANTLDIHLDGWLDTLTEFGLDMPRNFLDEYQGVPTLIIAEDLKRKHGFEYDADHFSQLRDQRVHERLHLATRIPAVTAVVEEYHGKLPMAVASGGRREGVDTILEAIGLANCFDAIVSADDPVAPKPDPAIFLEAARRLNVDPSACLVFEDGEPGILAAKKAGMTVIDVRLL